MMADTNAYGQVSVAELAYGQKPVYGRYPSDSGSGREDDGGETYQALVRRRIEENEMASTALEVDGQVGLIGKTV